MANFGTHLAWPTPDWVAYDRDAEIARARTPGPRRTSPSPIARIARALRRLARAWARAQAYNAFL